jgi:hypothetical protein
MVADNYFLSHSLEPCFWAAFHLWERSWKLVGERSQLFWWFVIFIMSWWSFSPIIMLKGTLLIILFSSFISPLIRKTL